MLFFLLVWTIAGAAPGFSMEPSLRVERVVVDAGHGGRDLGAVSARGLREKDVNLEIARMVRDGLRSRGLEVIMTRDSDRFIPLPNRAKVANRKKADLFVSVHSNASESRALKGFEVYSLSEATDAHARVLERVENSTLVPGEADPEDRELRAALWDLRDSANRRESRRLSNAIGDAALRSVPIAARRMRGANFHVLRKAECPAVLVETAYLSNKSDEAKLANPRYRRRIAEAIVKGIMDFKKKFDATNGFTA